MSLRFVLVWAFVLQTFAVVGLTGYLSFRNGQQAVNNLVDRLTNQVGDRVDQYLDEYLNNAQQINQINADAIATNHLDISDFRNMETYFWKQHRLYGFTYMNFGNPEGEFLGVGNVPNRIEIAEITQQNPGNLYSYYVDRQGNRLRLHHVERSAKTLLEPWYVKTVDRGRPMWSQIYNWADIPEEMSIAASYPVYDPQRRLRCVLAIDLSLSEISRFLRQLDFGNEGQSLILERSGAIVASSSDRPAYKIKNGKGERLQASDSQDPLIRATASHLSRQFGNLNNISQDRRLDFEFQGERQFVRVKPHRDAFGLDWLIVVAVPESEFMAQIKANTRTTIGLCIAALVIGVIVVTLTAKWISKPILHLNEATQKIATGKLDTTLKIESFNEVEELARSFNKMTERLKASFAELEGLNQALLQSESRLIQFLETIPMGIAVQSHEGEVTYLNLTAQSLFKTDRDGLNLSQTWPLYLAETDCKCPIQSLPTIRALKGESLILDNLEIRSDGGVIPLEIRAIPILDAKGYVTYAIATFQDISERKQAQQVLADYNRLLQQQVEERTLALQQEIDERKRIEANLHTANRELDRLARLDGLTQIANRRSFDEYLEKEWEISIQEKQPISLILADVDYFKLYNDTYGHQAGDICLSAIANVITKVTRKTGDLASRYGGEEFAAILPNTNLEGAIKVAQRIQADLQQLQLPHIKSQVSQQVTLSLGIGTIIAQANSSPAQLIAMADRALYQAKLEGRDRFAVAAFPADA
jgi:diguanylate cyclase (GGDEF)-like protein/PAS domain S-box-containing protein